jgi:hypothetical protein
MTKTDELMCLLEEGKKYVSADTFHYSAEQKMELDSWINDINLFAQNRLGVNELKTEITNACFFKDSKGLKVTHEKLMGLLLSLTKHLASEPLNNNPPAAQNTDAIHRPQMTPISENKAYDLFLSHANADKLSYVNDLYVAFSKLGIKIFYDKEELSWGDNWKEIILNGTAQSEFAVIVISQNFFGREWTERELNEFLNRQNASGQKIILPLLYNITFPELQDKYPALADIQAIQSEDKSKEEICILFAKELIKRLKGAQ